MAKTLAIKMELKQLKQTKSPEKKDKKTETFPDAESKMDDQIEIECTKHAAEDLDEASPAVGRIAMDLNARGNKIEGTKKELVHMSKEDEDIGFQGFESTAADLDEAITFLKETLTSPISCRHTSYTPVHARNVLGVSAMMAAQSIPPSSVQHRSPYTDAWFATATTIPQLPFPNASRFAGSSRMPIADSQLHLHQQAST